MRSLAPRSVPPCSSAADVLERLRRQPLARQHVRDARRVGRERLGRDRARPPRRPARPPAAPRNASRGVITSGPHGGGGANGSRARARGSPRELLDRLRAAPSTSRAACRPRVSPIPNTATTTFSPASSRLMSSLLAQQPRELVAARAGAAHVDREPQRVVAVHARAPGEPLVEHVEARRSRGSPRARARAPRIVSLEQLAAVARRRGGAPRRASRAAASWGSSTRPA